MVLIIRQNRTERRPKIRIVQANDRWGHLHSKIGQNHDLHD